MVKSKREQYMGLLRQKTRDLGRKVTFEDVKNDPKMPNPNDYAFYAGSFSNAADEAWATVRREREAPEREVLPDKPEVQSEPKRATPEADEFDAILNLALDECDELDYVPRQKSVWKSRKNLDFGRCVQVLGKSDFGRMVKVVQDAWDSRHPDRKPEKSDLLRLEEFDWQPKDWLDWLVLLQKQRGDSGKTLWQIVKHEYQPQFQRILHLFGNWREVESSLRRHEMDDDRQDSMIKAASLEVLEVTHGAEELKRKLILMTKKLGHVPKAWEYNKIRLEFDVPPYPEVRDVLGKGDLWPEVLGEPWKSMNEPREQKKLAETMMKKAAETLAEEPIGQKEEKSMAVENLEQQVEQEVEATKTKAVEETEVKQQESETDTIEARIAKNKSRKVRVNMSGEQMREFVLEAIKVLGVKPSKAQYEVYAREHGGPSTVTLAKHNLGISKWSKLVIDTAIAKGHPITDERADELVKELEELEPQSKEEPQSIETSQSETKVQSAEEAQSGKEAQSRTEAQSNEEGLNIDLTQILQVIIHGIDATVKIGGKNVRVKLDFGSEE